MHGISNSCFEPIINALCVKHMTTNWNSPHKHTFLKFLKTYNAFILFEFIDLLIVSLFLDESDHLLQSLFIALTFLELSRSCLNIHILRQQSSLAHAYSNDCSDTDANKDGHQDKQNHRNHTENTLAWWRCLCF